jgi:hypothetical protein
MHINFWSRSLTIRSLSLVLLTLAMSAGALAQFRVSITIAPPALPVYEQPVCPGDGYIWTPGYWYWDDDASDYFWVPGTWVMAPEVGFLWTPGWWGWGDGAFIFHEGYWGPEVGFYGGINYGFGYFGVGFAGGHGMKRCSCSWSGADIARRRITLFLIVPCPETTAQLPGICAS